MSGLTVDEIISHLKTELDGFEQAIITLDEERDIINKQRTEVLEEYRAVVMEYKLMMNVIRRIKPDVKDEDIVNQDLFFSDSARDKLLIAIEEEVSITGLLKRLFEQFPYKLWIPPELRDQLKHLQDKNLLKSKAKNLLWITHSSIKVLLKQKFIEKIEQDGKTYYKKL